MSKITIIKQSGIYYLVSRERKDSHNEKRKYIKSLGKCTKEEATKEIDKWKKILSFPSGEYDVIYADPPWKYDFSRSKSRSIENHYPTMELDDICRLEIPVGENAVLFIWATSPKLEQAFKVINSWGFVYKTSMVWVKDKVGMGYYARGQHELLLIAVKGKMPIPAPAKRRDSVIYAPVVGHSKKPEILYEIIESMYPKSNYLELFARSKRKGWASWGLDL
jgi:N6-adenosine-specific RNA methylase IME4